MVEENKKVEEKTLNPLDYIGLTRTYIPEQKKKQGYDDREDESLGERTGKESGKKQSMQDRRDESYGKWGKRDKKKNNKINKGKKK